MNDGAPQDDVTEEVQQQGIQGEMLDDVGLPQASNADRKVQAVAEVRVELERSRKSDEVLLGYCNVMHILSCKTQTVPGDAGEREGGTVRVRTRHQRIHLHQQHGCCRGQQTKRLGKCGAVGCRAAVRDLGPATRGSACEWVPLELGCHSAPQTAVHHHQNVGAQSIVANVGTQLCAWTASLGFTP
eukprot:1148920-Pelagomonas_calceolata.AAC.2